jgi:hypothetical protein
MFLRILNEGTPIPAGGCRCIDRQRIARDHLTARRDDAALYRVLELAHVPRPVMTLERVDRIGLPAMWLPHA